MQKEQAEVSKKYRYTKQLVRIAIENGYTNADVAVKAGLSAKSISQVSRWRNGEALATERQMRALVNEFGHLLKRKMEHLFYRLDENNRLSFYLLSGETLLKHITKIRNDDGKSVSVRRTIIIRCDDIFAAIYQQRLGYDRRYQINVDDLANSDNEDANWTSTNIEKFEDPQRMVDTILHTISTYDIPRLNVLNEQVITAYKVRQTLLKAGFATADIRTLDISTTSDDNE
ncbi:hypothetical protein HR45_17000 [Shewanella mangrovi]|uniref:Uncharacterized protein n=1 Tax=Shewanella mangrovi TaxID=1515746 RepID=A0A094LMN2_9GAMM|nr:hypothetical protein [Shewanella mangrovi]KFZ36353.1 hypothetical protein HR45_17000 [Shewanella mangrovi]